MYSLPYNPDKRTRHRDSKPYCTGCLKNHHVGSVAMKSSYLQKPPHGDGYCLLEVSVELQHCKA